MIYQKVFLNEKTVVGFTKRTTNDSPEMGAIIAELWQRLLGEKGAKTPQKGTKNDLIGLYSDYKKADSAQNLEYDITVGFEAEPNCPVPAGMTKKHIPEGSYAVFSVEGGIEAVGEFWQKIWSIPLDRRYSGDFELYSEDNDRIEIYIALN